MRDDRPIPELTVGIIPELLIEVGTRTELVEGYKVDVLGIIGLENGTTGDGLKAGLTAGIKPELRISEDLWIVLVDGFEEDVLDIIGRLYERLEDDLGDGRGLSMR